MGDEPVSLKDALRKADAFMEKRDYRSAVSAFTEVLRLDPRLAYA
jgi:hypothetical protein